MTMKHYLVIGVGFVALLWLTACSSNPNGDRDPVILGTYSPVYCETKEVKNIRVMGPQVLNKTGKIYYKDNFLFIGEQSKGVHIIDNKDPKNPKKIAFLSIPGAQDVAIKGNYLYVDNYTDLVTLNVADPNNVKVVSRQENVFPAMTIYPPYTNIRFICPDPKKGVIVGWESIEDTEEARCFR